MKIVDLYCGTGGLSYGFKLAKHEIVLGVDNNKDCCKTFESNCGKSLCADMLRINADDIPDCDVIVGGPPCEEFSYANTKRTLDLTHVKRFLEIVRLKKPRYYLMENVMGLTNAIKLQFMKLDACDYGVPQHRKRVFYTNITRPKQTHAEQKSIDLEGNIIEKWITVEEALGIKGIMKSDRPDQNFANSPFYNSSRPSRTIIAKNPPYIYLEHGKYRGRDKDFRFYNINNPSPTLLTDNRFKLYFSKKAIEGAKKHTTRHRLKGHGFGTQILDINKPSKVITAHIAKSGISSDPIIEDEYGWRRLSVEECAILQSFPKDYQFCGSKTSIYRQIGRAVPPLLAYAFAKQICNIY